MKRFSFFMFLLIMLGQLCYANDKNIAYQDATVRFTVISDGTLRLEYSPDGKFVDNKSFVAVNREYDKVDCKVKAGSWIEITTPAIKLRYKKNSGPFTENNLVISSVSKQKGAFRFVWKPGMKQQHNLKGTFRTLDCYDGDVRIKDTQEGKTGGRMEIEDGLLAKDGWTLIDDSNSLLFDGSEGIDWVTKRQQAEGSQDRYFMAYGNDYKKALKDFTRFAGKMPLPPRYAFGYWWSRYWTYSDKELRNVVNGMRDYGFPLDVLVIDMDWHYTEQGKGGWTGWTWNKELFPNYRKMLKDFKNDGLNITLNLHPNEGVAAYEEKYPEIARVMGIDPASKKRVEFMASDKKMFTSLFDKILNPMMNEGVDFWWLDWQQHIYDRKMPELKNTWWINHCFFTNMELNSDKRPMLYHRWGGLGNHRYQIGFSGDAVISWASLDFQPYFNSTASNVLYGYWSHDLGGHMYGVNRIEPEMYTRWMQFGALSPIMRSHSTKSSTLKKEPWIFDFETCSELRHQVRQRYEMAPYIYTMARKAYDEGIALCRPMYYDYPKAQEAYDYRNEYMFGDQMLVSPITSPMQGSYSQQKTWLPAGQWYEVSTGCMLNGGEIVEREYAIDEYPLFVKAGSVLPYYNNKVENLKANNEEIVVTVFPGDEGGEFLMYEDNGDDKKYDAEYATTLLSNKVEGNTQTITIAARNGKYKDMPARRTFSLKLLNRFLPKEVTVNGQPAKCSYSGDDFAVLVEIPETDCNVEKVIRLTYEDTDQNLDGMKAMARRMAKEMEALKYRDARVIMKAPFAILGSVSEAMYYADPVGQPQVVKNFRDSYTRLPELLEAQKMNEDQKAAFIKAVNWK